MFSCCSSKAFYGYMSRNTTKPTKWVCAQRRHRSAWASTQSDESSLSAWRKLGSLVTHWAHSEDSDQTGRMPRLIWVFAGCTVTLLVWSCRSSYGITFSIPVIKWSCNTNSLLQGQFAPVKGNYGQEFKDLIMKMLNQDPAERPSAHELMYSDLPKVCQ